MRDWFAAFVTPSVPGQHGQHGQQGRSRARTVPISAAPGALDALTHRGQHGATDAGVARVAQDGIIGATGGVKAERTEFCHSSGSVAHVAHVAYDADWRELYEERAAFRQCEAGYQRDMAERLAFGEVIEAWCRLHPQGISSTICAGCARPVAEEVIDLPDGARVHWERHREFACLIEAGFRRKERALKALAAMGLVPPPS